MRTVQLDKNAGSNKLKDQCNEEGLVECFLLPRRPINLRDEGTDREVVDFAIQKNNLMTQLTAVLEQNANRRAISDPNTFDAQTVATD